ncbi:hypothetical protein SLS62_003694 [Diatrype stigma]|uniref:deoxyribose-phosphate aldolase n=1 Tax=Diatrype stigma TaxID=117547 RepID=A0AAN9YR84_9PEZI
MTTSVGTMMVSLPQIAKVIDHSLLHPTLTDAQIRDGLMLAKKHKVATACIKPYSIPLAKEILEGSDVLVCAVIGFPHGNSTTFIKVLEAEEAAKEGAREIDMVVNVGKVLSGEWAYVADEIRAVNEAVVQHGAVLKVIFENDFVAAADDPDGEQRVVRLCQICTELSVAFVKTSTGYGFVKVPDGSGYYTYRGATIPHLRLMLRNVGAGVQVKAAGGIRTLDELLYVMWLGVTRIGATATAEILKEASRRGIKQEPVEVPIPAIVDTVDTAGRG